MKESLQKCPDKNAKLNFILRTFYLDDDVSVDSSKYTITMD